MEEYPIFGEEDWQVVLRSDDHPVRIRDIKSNLVSKLFTVSGIIISTTKPFIKASKLKVQCRSCGNTKTIELQPGQWPYVPSFCPGQEGRTQKCPRDSFVALPTSEVIDTQSLKIQ
jgi:DNA replication licensing factor MCM5